MNNLDKQYQALLQDILDNGVHKEDRTGTGTLSVFGRQIRHKMSEGFPILTTKKMYFKGIVTELLWFLRGDTNIKYLVDNDCHIWDGDAYKAYLKKRTTANKDNVREPHTLANGMTGQISRAFTKEEFINKIKTDDEFAKTWGELGPVYGKQWRRWGGYEKIPNGWTHGSISSFKEVPKLDQIQNLINDLKTNPDSRRLMVNAWNVGELDSMTLPPCHYGFQVYTRELSDKERMKLAGYEDVGGIGQNMIREIVDMNNSIPRRAISLMWNQRSCDVPLGIPFNITSYALLLEIIAKEVNMVPDELIGNLGDCHIYKNQIDGVKEQLTRESYQLPKLKLDDWYSTQGDVNNSTEVIMDCLMDLNHGHITLENYQSHQTIKIPLSN
jgi:thymidylate synthase